MKRKLRKPLSWLLTFAMVISLFCGMIPSASAAEYGNENGIITIDCAPAIIHDNKTSMDVQVKVKESSSVLESFTVDNIKKTTSTMTISVNQAYLAEYEIDSIEISTDKNYTGWNDDWNTAHEKQITFSTGVGENPTLTVYLSENENVLELTDNNNTIDMGVIAYRPGNQTTTVEIYLNYEKIHTYNDVGIHSGTNNFILSLNDGYYYGIDVDGGVEIDAPLSFESSNDAQSITWASPYTHLNYSITDGVDSGIKNTVKLYFFDYNNGVNVDLNRNVNGNLAYWDADEACPSLEIQFEDEDYTYTYENWNVHESMYVPRGTTVYVVPTIGENYGFNVIKRRNFCNDYRYGYGICIPHGNDLGYGIKRKIFTDY